MSANSPPQDSGSQSSVVWVLRILAAAAVGWLIWGWMEYSGPYKWASELQLQMAGSYDEKLSFIGPLIVIAVIVGVLSSMFGATGQLMGGATGDRLRRAGQPATAVDQRRSARVVLLLGAATTLGGALVAGYGFLPHAPASIGTLDITAGEHAPPDTDRVAFTGVERRQFARVLVTKNTGYETRTTYIPLTSAAWRPGDPIAYFLETTSMYGERSFIGDEDGRGGLTIQRAALSRNGMAGLIREGYRSAGVALADPYYVISESSENEDADKPFIIGAIAGLVGVMFLLAGLISLMIAKRRQRVRPAP